MGEWNGEMIKSVWNPIHNPFYFCCQTYFQVKQDVQWKKGMHSVPMEACFRQLIQNKKGNSDFILEFRFFMQLRIYILQLFFFLRIAWY